MSGITPHLLYAVKIEGSDETDLFFDQVTTQDFDPATNLVTQALSGSVDPQSNYIGTKDPTFSIQTTALKTFLDGISIINGLQIVSDVDDDGIELWFQKVVSGGSRQTGGNHIKLTVNKGFISPLTISASEGGGPATLDFLIAALYDGTNNAVVKTVSQSLEGTPAVDENYVMGKVEVNGTDISDLESWTLDLGLQLAFRRGAGDVAPSLVWIQERQPSLVARTADLAVLDYLDGVALSSTAVAYLRKVAEGSGRVADATAEHIKFTINAGMVSVENTSASGNDPAIAEIRITPKWDGSNDIIVKSTTSAIT